MLHSYLKSVTFVLLQTITEGGLTRYLCILPMFLTMCRTTNALQNIAAVEIKLTVGIGFLSAYLDNHTGMRSLIAIPQASFQSSSLRGQFWENMRCLYKRVCSDKYSQNGPITKFCFQLNFYMGKKNASMQRNEFYFFRKRFFNPI